MCRPTVRPDGFTRWQTASLLLHLAGTTFYAFVLSAEDDDCISSCTVHSTPSIRGTSTLQFWRETRRMHRNPPQSRTELLLHQRLFAHGLEAVGNLGLETRPTLTPKPELSHASSLASQRQTSPCAPSLTSLWTQRQRLRSYLANSCTILV